MDINRKKALGLAAARRITFGSDQTGILSWYKAYSNVKTDVERCQIPKLSLPKGYDQQHTQCKLQKWKAVIRDIESESLEYLTAFD